MYIYVYIYICRHTFRNTYVCIYMYVYIYMYVNMCVCTCTYICIYIHISIHIHTYVCLCMSVCSRFIPLWSESVHSRSSFHIVHTSNFGLLCAHGIAPTSLLQQYAAERRQDVGSPAPVLGDMWVHRQPRSCHAGFSGACFRPFRDSQRQQPPVDYPLEAVFLCMSVCWTVKSRPPRAPTQRTGKPRSPFISHAFSGVRLSRNGHRQHRSSRQLSLLLESCLPEVLPAN